MPFIKEERREMVRKDQYASVSKTPEGIQAGDRCFFYYEPMVKKWKAEPRWTTAHKIYKEMQQAMFCQLEEEDMVAYQLAWQMFFTWWVVGYEKEQEKLNGKI